MVTVDRELADCGMARRLISTPIKANGAQQVTAHGIPQIATSKVAERRDRARGAKIMVAANMRCDINHAVCRSGRTLVILFRTAATPGGGRGVKVGFLLSGGRTPKGRRTELTNVIQEKMTRERLPRRPTSPRVSFDSAASLGASYRK